MWYVPCTCTCRWKNNMQCVQLWTPITRPHIQLCICMNTCTEWHTLYMYMHVKYCRFTSVSSSMNRLTDLRHTYKYILELLTWLQSVNIVYMYNVPVVSVLGRRLWSQTAILRLPPQSRRTRHCWCWCNCSICMYMYKMLTVLNDVNLDD